jgi:proteasome accessory factor B
MSKPTKLQRHLDLIAYLVGRRLPVAVDELLERIPAYGTGASARRMFERDKDELRKQGIPLKTIKYSIEHGSELTEGYVIERRDFYLPYLKLVTGDAAEGSGYPDHHRPGTVEITEAHAPLALEALRRVADVPSFPFLAEARSAFRKLAFDIDPDAFSKKPAVLFADRPQDADIAASLKLLSDALLRRKRVKFEYRGMYKGDVTERDVAGFGMLFQSGQWYFIGHDALRDDIRVFRVSRMRDVVPNTASPNTADYEVPATFKLDDYVGRQAWELGDQDEQPIVARVLFRFPLSVWAERNGHGEAEVRNEDGSVVRRFAVHQVNPFLRWLLGMQHDVEVLEPPEFRGELKDMARKVAASHAEDA